MLNFQSKFYHNKKLGSGGGLAQQVLLGVGSDLRNPPNQRFKLTYEKMIYFCSKDVFY